MSFVSSPRFKNKVVLITGGTSGIGKVTAIAFAKEKAKVVFTGRGNDLGTAVVSEIEKFNGIANYIEIDHTIPDECQKCVDITINRFGHIDILHNNAGIMIAGSAERLTDQEWHKTFDINVFAVWRMSKLVLPYMRKQGGGNIINTASDYGILAGKNAVAYCASKGAVVQITKAMALDHAHENIRVNAVCPSDVLTERLSLDGLWQGNGPPNNIDNLIIELGKQVPIGRIAKPEDIASVVLFLASNDASFITGSAIMVDGGLSAM